MTTDSTRPPAPGTIPFVLATWLGTIVFAAGGAYVTQSINASQLHEVAVRLDDHVRAPSHAVAAERLAEQERRIVALEHAVESTSASEVALRTQLEKIAHNIDALCQASRAANCVR